MVLAGLLLSIIACQNSTTTEETTEPPKDSITTPEPPKIIPIKGMPISLVVTTQTAIIRQAPSLEAAEIARYSKGDSLLFTNKISGFNTPIKLEGIAYNEPWLRIILPGNQMGWIYGGCINFKASEHPQLKTKVLDQRAVALFGTSLAQQIKVYQKETERTTTLPAFRALYSRAELLKDSLETLIDIHLKTNTTKELPDFFWLNELMDGMLIHYVEEHQRYYLFKDLKYWKEISLQTADTTDDQFVDVLLAAYPSDSIEYYFYGWQLPIDSLTLCSLLGSDIHSNVLDKLQVALDSNSYFQEEMLAIKKAIVDDISISAHYWLPLESIQQELAAIIKKRYPFLVSSDWVELKTRQQMLKKYHQNNIALNLFEGQ